MTAIAGDGPLFVDPSADRLRADMRRKPRGLTDKLSTVQDAVARLVNDGWTPTARAIAAERQTAVHIDPRNGRAEIFATPEHPTPYAYFLRTTRPPDRCVPGRPLLIRDVAVYRVAPGGEFDLHSWSGRNGIRYTLSASEGVLRSSRGGIY